MPADTPSGYVAGTVSVPANTPVSLGKLIQQQIDPNAPLGVTYCGIQPDSTNTTPVLIGSSNKVGTGAPVQYGRSLAATDPPQALVANAQAIIPLGSRIVFSTAAALLHVEIWP